MFDIVKSFKKILNLEQNECVDDNPSSICKNGAKIVLIIGSEHDAYPWEGIICKINENSFLAKAPNHEDDVFFKEDQILPASVPYGEKTAKFETKVISITSKPKHLTLELAIPEKVEWFLTYKRVHERIRLRMPAGVKPEKVKNDIWEDSKITDFGAGGMGILTDRKFKKGDIVEVNLEVIKFPYVLKGIVTRISEEEDRSDTSLRYKIGVEFTDMGLRDRERLAQALRDYKKSSRL